MGGLLTYTMKQTRLDIFNPLGTLAKHMSNPGPAHIKALDQLLRYLNSTQDLNLTCVSLKRQEVQGYCDVDYDSCSILAKSVTGWVTTMGRTALS